MNLFLIFLLGVGLGAGVVWVFMKKRKGELELELKRTEKEKTEKEGKERLIEKQAREKEENKRKILELFESRQRVANNDIETLLGVSDATATRYFDELEKEGLIRQVGKIGRHVYYEKIQQ